MFGRSDFKKGATAMLHVRVSEAKNLMAMDDGNTSDPYVTLKVGPDGKQKCQTKTIDKTVNPVWNEDFTLYGFPRIILACILLCLSLGVGMRRYL